MTVPARMDPIQGWREEKDFFSRWSLYPPEPELLDMIEATGARSLLDLGCGGAPYLSHFHAKGWRVLGRDVSPEAVAVQRRVLPSECVEEGSLFDARVAAPFEAGLLRGVLYYYPTEDKLRFLEEIAPELVSGTLILEEFVVDRLLETQDYRGIAQYWENWSQLLGRLRRWEGVVRPKQDPNFLARFIQSKKPDYKPSDELKLAQWIVLRRKA